MGTMRRAVVGLLYVLAMSHAAHAQVVVDDTPVVFDPPAGLFSTGPRLTSAPDGERIIRATLGSDQSYGAPVLRDLASKDFYVVIHVLKWEDPTADGSGKTTQTVQAQNWYVFRGGSGWTLADFTTARRLFGSKGFYLLAIHLNHAQEAGSYRLNYRVTIAKKQAANVANLLAAAKLLGADFGAALKAQSVALREDLWAGRFVHVDDVPSDITIAPEIVALGSDAAATTTAAAAVSPGRGFSNVPAPPPTTTPTTTPAPAPPLTDDQKAIAALTQRIEDLEKPVNPSPQSLGDAQKFDNEGKYFWDVSIGVPVRTVSDFTRTTNGLDVKTVTKSTAFALLNIYFRPVDVKTPALNLIPHALVGFGLEKKPLDRLFIGGGWGPVYAHFFAGVAFKRVEADGKTTYPREVTFGLNVPILSITKRLSEQAK